MRTTIVLSLMLCVFSIRGVEAATIWGLQGKADPTSQEWNYNALITAGSAGVAGPVGPVGPAEAEVATENAWKITDAGADSRPVYESPRMTAAQEAEFANGWALEVRMSSPLASTTAQSRGFQFITPGSPESGKVYRVYVTTDTALQQTVTVYNLNSQQRPTSTLSAGFHTYRLVGTPNAGGFDVSLYIDNAPAPAVTNISGFVKSTVSSVITPTPNSSLAQIGSFSTGGAATLYFSSASLTLVPEGSSLMLASSALVGMTICQRRRRKCN